MLIELRAQHVAQSLDLLDAMPQVLLVPALHLDDRADAPVGGSVERHIIRLPAMAGHERIAAAIDLEEDADTLILDLRADVKVYAALPRDAPARRGAEHQEVLQELKEAPVQLILLTIEEGARGLTCSCHCRRAPSRGSRNIGPGSPRRRRSAYPSGCRSPRP